jgi:ATP/maltotriose-dependent transcriptional regulator MalT
LSRIESSDASGDLLLRAQVLLCLSRPSELIRADFVGKLAGVDSRYRFLAQAFLASAYFRVRLQDTGESVLQEAYRSAESSSIPDASAWVEYYDAFYLWSQGKLSEAEQRLLRPLRAGDAILRAKALALGAWIEGSRERYESQIEGLQKALDTLPPCEDLFTAAKILHALAALSCNLFRLELAVEVERRANAIPWSEDMRAMQLEIMRSVAWNHALAGRFVPALRLLRRNENIADSAPSRVVALLDRARICFGSGETLNYRAYLESADELATTCDWANTPGEERFSLLTLAALWAPSDPIHARGVLEKYRVLCGSTTKTSAWGNGDRRRMAAEHYSAGVVLRYLNQHAESVEHLQSAFKIYEGIGYYWRAALCAYHLDGANPELLERATQWIEQYFPHAWFAPLFAGLRTAEKDGALQSLGRSRRQILHFVIQGRAVKDIAEILNREEKTIRNHLSAIFKAFGVHHIEDLRAECARRGIT